MNSQEYWKKRALLAKQKEMASTAEYEAAMRSRLKDLENEFIKESKNWITKYANENNQSLKEAANYLKSIDTSKFDMTLAEFEAKARAGGFEKELNSAYYKTRIARLQELYRQYQELAAKYADNEENNMAIGLAKRYEDTYLLENYNKYLVVGGLDVNFTHFNEQELKDIVYQPWKGSNFSKRIWNNYTKVMPEVLTDVMFRSTALGYSYNRVERVLRDRFQGVVKSNIHRLVVTEMGHAAEQATKKFYKDSDIDQYQYLATLETHTCEVCAHLDGRIFYVKDEKEGINYPLIHPYCRCSTVPYIEGLPDIPTRWYRDPVTGKGKWTRNMSYSEWAKATDAKTFNKKKFIETKPQAERLQAPKLSINEERAVIGYVSPAAYDLNDRLRNGYPLSQQQKEMVRDLDTALDKIPYYSDEEPLNRSLTFMYPDDEKKFIRDALNKGYIQEKSYASSTQHGVYDKDDRVRMVIKRSHSGRDLKNYTLDGENEVLFNRNTKFIVTNMYQENGKQFIEVVEDGDQ